jgi:predicted Holliday junction resolvase-like endonuclease
MREIKLGYQGVMSERHKKLNISISMRKVYFELDGMKN